MTIHRCDVIYSLPLRDQQALGLVDHEAGEHPYKVTEPGAMKSTLRFFCSIEHLAIWAQKAVAR